MFAASDLTQGFHKNTQNVQPVLDLCHQLFIRYSTCTDLGLFLIFSLGMLVRQLLLDLEVRRWVAFGRGVIFLLFLTFVLLEPSEPHLFRGSRD